jgi:hypothetical protein
MHKAVVLFAFAAIAGAAEDAQDLTFSDVRLTLSSLPTKVHTKLDNKSTGVSATSDDTIDSSGEIAIGYQYSHYKDNGLGFLVGIDLDIIGTKDESNGVKDTTSNVGPAVQLGLGYRVNSLFNLEGTLVGGIGFSSEKVSGFFSKDIESTSGAYTKIGVLIRAVFTLKPGLQLFAQGGYLSFEQTLKYDADPSINLGQLEFTNTAKGGTFGLGAGWRF